MLIRLILLLLALSPAACSKKKENTSKQTLHLNLTDDPASLDPRAVRRLKDLTLVKQLYEGLMRLDAAGIPQPALAQRVDISEDFLSYTFHLRDSNWNNHEPVTAHDFETSWLEILNREFISDYAYMMNPVQQVQALDEKTLHVVLKMPTPYFLELTAFPTYYPVYKKDISVSNGPFSLDQWTMQREIVLKKNPFYWDNQNVHLDSIAFSVIPDNNTESLLFEKNELDWLGQPISHNITPEILAKLKEKGMLSSYPVAGTFWLLFNTEKEPFNNENVRKAISYAINRQEIITHILQGNQTPATRLVPPSMISGSLFEDGNISEAKRLMQEIGPLPTLTLSYPPGERDAKIAQLIQDQLQSTLGIHVELIGMEAQLHRRHLSSGNFMMGTGSWFADYHDPLAFLELFQEKDGSLNTTRWHNERFSALLEQSMTDPENRLGLLDEAEKILIAEMPLAPLYHCTFDYVKQPYVHDVVLSPLGLADFKSAWIKQETR